MLPPVERELWQSGFRRRSEFPVLSFPFLSLQWAKLARRYKGRCDE